MTTWLPGWTVLLHRYPDTTDHVWIWARDQALTWAICISWCKSVAVEFDGCHGTLSSVETHLGQWHVAEQCWSRGGFVGVRGLTRCFSCELSALSSFNGTWANLRHVLLSFMVWSNLITDLSFQLVFAGYGYDKIFPKRKKRKLQRKHPSHLWIIESDRDIVSVNPVMTFKKLWKLTSNVKPADFVNPSSSQATSGLHKSWLPSHGHLTAFWDIKVSTAVIVWTVLF